ncbi:hypothetical protein ABFS82_10G088400 [Erythranthe guttata]|uniref:Uncharacterized protein n=1 Tax=Erythranthe guttata TaxID=4155 RepID=A0A022QF53_ERYGU|nr:PREDICTED: myb-like protein J [Erythranthe guttata]EYU27307.1 hypothetical protein MIMGU_mgv1a011837mg [Erythranthe guttata]|eukprot:XP_012848948.1 PREDICTED: myb-like protein J [Erythranthe guttata]
MKMGRKCSQCGNIGHNSRTCNNISKGAAINGVCGSVRLFGVQLDNISSYSYTNNNNIHMKKSFSLDCLSSTPSALSSSSSLSSSTRIPINDDKASIGYLSDGNLARIPERKKGVPWTEEEHRTFLIGLEKLGKGDWRGISRNYVTSRTPTQVASHAQKYFLRQASITKKKRRSSLFDMAGGKDNAGSEKVSTNNSKWRVRFDLNSFGGDEDDDDCKKSSERECGGEISPLIASSQENFVWSYESSYSSNAGAPPLELTLSAPMGPIGVS